MSGKTHKGIQKRLKKTGTGKLMHRRPNKARLLSGKSSKRKRRLRRWAQLGAANCKMYERQFGKLL